MPCLKRKHTPIVSKKQFGLFGAEYARRRTGKSSRMAGITTEELRSHLKEAGGKRFLKKKKRQSAMQRGIASVGR